MACSRTGSSAVASIDASASSATAPEASPPATAAGSSAIATVKLLDPGQPPRRALRYTWNLGHKEQLSMDLRTSASTETAGARQADVPLPPVHVTLAIDPQSISPEGDLAYRWRVTSASVATGPEFPVQVVDGMRAEVTAIEHLKGTATVTSRGLSTDVAIEPGSAADAGATGQMVEQIRQTLRDVAAPLPEEDVGQGARWQKLSELEARETRITQTETFRLVAAEAGPHSYHGTLDDVLAQTAPAQPLHAPGMPESAAARLESMLASGNAKVRFDLARLVPQTQFEGTTTMVVSGRPSSDSAQRMTMVMRVGISIQGTAR
jgi:hypothetical protein